MASENSGPNAKCVSPDKWTLTVRHLLALHSRRYEQRGPQKDLAPLKFYYKHFFPFEDLCAWLSYGNYEDFHLREFAYTSLPNFFSRYKSYDCFREMKYEICNIVPIKLDIGAIFNVRPTIGNRNKSDVRPSERELTFDIDLSDYNDVRTCCIDDSACSKCWKFAAVACKILDSSFREDFGWRHILWVYSGRRGIHCWVCDTEARRMTGRQRKKFVEYFNLRRQGSATNLPINLGTNEFIHAQIDRSYKIAMEQFVTICVDEQDIFGKPETVKKFISLLPNDAVRQKVIELFEQCSTSLEKWDKFDRYWEFEEQSRTDLWKSRPHLTKEIILYYLYPRIDEAVTVGMNHLLKAPFSFHPKTRRLSVPFDPKKIDEFVVSEVPTLYEFSEKPKNSENNCDGAVDDRSRIPKYEESLRVFKNFVKSFVKSSSGEINIS